MPSDKEWHREHHQKMYSCQIICIRDNKMFVFKKWPTGWLPFSTWWFFREIPPWQSWRTVSVGVIHQDRNYPKSTGTINSELQKSQHTKIKTQQGAKPWMWYDLKLNRPSGAKEVTSEVTYDFEHCACAY